MTATGSRDGAEVLREAARVMRERAQAATPGPWTPDPRAPHDVRGNGMRNLVATTGGMIAASENTGHIAAWNPAVALTVAAVLEEAADEAEGIARLYAEHFGRPRPEWAKQTAAMALARTYLDEESP